MPSKPIVGAVVAGVLLAASAPAGAVRAGATKLSPPVVRESFTLLPCSGRPNARTTLQQEGCAEHEIVAGDARINTLSRSIFGKLHDDPARRRFVGSAQAWLRYRDADCLSLSDVFEGGSQAPVIDAQCKASRNGQRIRDLRAFLADLAG